MWANECLTCGQSNYSMPFRRPDTCSACGRPLVCVEADPNDNCSEWHNAKHVEENWRKSQARIKAEQAEQAARREADRLAQIRAAKARRG